MQFKLAQVWSALAFRLTAGKLLRLMPTQDDIRNALKAVKYPGYDKPTATGYGCPGDIADIIAHTAVKKV